VKEGGIVGTRHCAPLRCLVRSNRKLPS
jgi:hypothetical protein